MIEESEVPSELQSSVESKRAELIANLANVNEQIGEYFLMEEEPPADLLRAALRSATIARQIVPVFMGSAFKNVGVQKLLDGVTDYLPNPSEVENRAIDCKTQAREVLPSRSDAPFVGLAFKLEEGRFGQLTYMRVYQGKLVRGAQIYNMNGMRKVKVPRLVRMHSNEMEDVDEVAAGEICAMFGVDCFSGDTFTDGTLSVSMVHSS